jgi:hypothetical protein
MQQHGGAERDSRAVYRGDQWLGILHERINELVEGVPQREAAVLRTRKLLEVHPTREGPAFTS